MQYNKYKNILHTIKDISYPKLNRRSEHVKTKKNVYHPKHFYSVSGIHFI
jgi:hypothetical protein